MLFKLCKSLHSCSKHKHIRTSFSQGISLNIYALLKELHSSYYYDAEDDYIPEAGKYASKQTTTTAM